LERTGYGNSVRGVACLETDGRDLEVLIVDEGVVVRVGRGVGAGPERFEIGCKGSLPGLVEAAECDLSGAEVLAEKGYASDVIGG
jgi:hypothetical protein